MKKKLHIIVLAAVSIMMLAGIHITQEFRFYNIESNTLFLYDWSDIWAKLVRTGGLSTLMASFLTQFMRIPAVGPLIVTAVYLLAAYLFYKVICVNSDARATSGIAFLPAAFLFLCMENDYYRFQGHMAFLLMLTALYAYVSVPKEKMRYAAGVLLVPLLYQTAGSVAVVFAVSALVWEVCHSGIRGLKAMAYPVIVALTALLYVRCSLVSSWEHALTPFMYYDWPSTYFFPIYAWTLVPVLILASRLLGLFRLKPSSSMIVAALGLAVSFFIAGNFYSKVHSGSYYRLIQEQYWAENEEWDKIIKTADRRRPTFLVSYLNLALAQKGMLVRNYMYYNPQDLSSLMFPTQNLKTGLSLQSNVYMAWGYLGSARKAAFDGNVVTPGSCHPRQLQALVKINLVLGAHEVAEKYILLLEKTLFYRDWACDMRRFLNDPDAIASDEVLGVMHASLPLTDEYARYEGIRGDMRDIHEACPSNRILAQFYELYQILEENKR